MHFLMVSVSFLFNIFKALAAMPEEAGEVKKGKGKGNNGNKARDNSA